MGLPNKIFASDAWAEMSWNELKEPKWAQKRALMSLNKQAPPMH